MGDICPVVELIELAMSFFSTPVTDEWRLAQLWAFIALGHKIRTDSIAARAVSTRFSASRAALIAYTSARALRKQRALVKRLIECVMWLGAASTLKFFGDGRLVLGQTRSDGLDGRAESDLSLDLNTILQR